MKALSIFAIVLALSTTSAIAANFGDLDKTFNTGRAVRNTADIFGFILYPDGSTAVNGSRYLQNGRPDLSGLRGHNGRVLSDGRTISLGNGILQGRWDQDADFRDFWLPANGPVHDIAEYNGGVIAVGSFFEIGGIARNKIAAINSQGTVLPLFADLFLQMGTIRAVVVQTDGKIVVGGDAGPNRSLIRLKSNGTIDSSFAPILPNEPPFRETESVNALAIQADGNLLVAKTYPTSTGQAHIIGRVFPDGSVDATFASSERAGKLLVQRDGRIIAGGPSETFRLLADGSLDPSFPRLSGSTSQPLALASDGSIYVRANEAGGFWYPEGVVKVRPDGTPDLSYCPTGPFGEITAAIPEPGGSLIVAGRFKERPFEYLGYEANRFRVSSTVRSRFAREGIARLDDTGQLVPGFELPPGQRREVIKMVKVRKGYLVINEFHPRLARYQFDGTIDPTFQIISSEEWREYSSENDPAGIDVYPDGRILISGEFTRIRGLSSNRYVVRLTEDGALDSSFDASFNPNGQRVGPFRHLKLSANGQIYCSNPASIQRLHSNGSLDTSYLVGFFSEYFFGPDIYAIAPAANNGLWVSGFLGTFEMQIVSDLVQFSSTGRPISQSYLRGSARKALLSLPEGLLLTPYGRVRADGTVENDFYAGGSAIGIGQSGDMYFAGGDSMFASRRFGDASATPMTFSSTDQTGARWRLSGLSGAPVIIETSDDLSTWTSAATNTFSNSETTFTLPRIQTQRFLRARLHR